MVPEKLKEFVENVEGMSKGRYHILYLTIIGIAGGEELRKEAQEKYGRERYLPDEMYPVKEQNQMAIHAVEQGVSAERMGRMVPQTYKRANPDIFATFSRDNAIELLVAGWESDTEYAEKSIVVLEREKNRAVLARPINPMPCDFFKGVLLGLFEILDIPAKCEEIKCQWTDEGEDACVYEITWE